MSGRAYRVVRTLGVGGFGTVYHARVEDDGGFTKDVALKIMSADAVTHSDVAQRMRDEARMLGLVRHRAIVHVDGLTQLDGRWAVVMELVEGVDLRSLLRKGPIPAAPALEITREVASAIHAAYHTAGPQGPLRLLHRDIKPSNIQLTALGEVKVLDFGIARADFDNREAATQGILFGTPKYMAPERFCFEEDHVSDVYALGATLYEILGGRPLGRAHLEQERHAAHVADALARLHEQAPIRPDIADFVASLLQFDAARRPTAREVERRCTRILSTVSPPSLRDWSEVEIPPLLHARRTATNDPLIGASLFEQAELSALTWADVPKPRARARGSASAPITVTVPMGRREPSQRSSQRPEGSTTTNVYTSGPRPPVAEPAADRGTPCRVLVVDDEPDFTDMIREYLELRGGWEVEVADGGFTAGLTVARFRPHIILLDILMPDMDGFETLRRLRADPDTRDIPVVACTALRDADIEDRIAHQFDGHLRKPLRLEDLALTLVRICKRGSGA